MTSRVRPIDSLSAAEVARAARCSRQAVDYARAAGRLDSFVDVDGHRWFRDSDVARWLASRPQPRRRRRK